MIGKIKEKLTDGKTVIVGIDGLGGAGKVPYLKKYMKSYQGKI